MAIRTHTTPKTAATRPLLPVAPARPLALPKLQPLALLPARTPGQPVVEIRDVLGRFSEQTGAQFD